LPRALRRSEARLPFKLQVDIAGRQGVSCETFDLSPHGCFLVTDAKFSIGEVLRLTLHVDGPVEVEGTVVRVSEQPMGIGIRFATSPRRLALALRDFHAVAAAA
jgi:hypothetical protein